MTIYSCLSSCVLACTEARCDVGDFQTKVKSLRYEASCNMLKYFTDWRNLKEKVRWMLYTRQRKKTESPVKTCAQTCCNFAISLKPGFSKIHDFFLVCSMGFPQWLPIMILELTWCIQHVSQVMLKCCRLRAPHLAGLTFTWCDLHWC